MDDSGQNATDGYLTGHLLLAMPCLQGSFFERSVIYICAHSKAGAMGIVINQPVDAVKFDDLLGQLKIAKSELKVDLPVHLGGPVDPSRGFVLHTQDFVRDETVRIDNGLGVTGTLDILRAIAQGRGPAKHIFALGYTGWGPGQLETEIEQNSWLSVPADQHLIFDTKVSDKWQTALKKIGVDPANLASLSGSA